MLSPEEAADKWQTWADQSEGQAKADALWMVDYWRQRAGTTKPTGLLRAHVELDALDTLHQE